MLLSAGRLEYQKTSRGFRPKTLCLSAINKALLESVEESPPDQEVAKALSRKAIRS